MQRGTTTRSISNKWVNVKRMDAKKRNKDDNKRRVTITTREGKVQASMVSDKQCIAGPKIRF